MRCPNQRTEENPFLFRLFAVLPERDPPGPRPEQVLLGSEFLLHYGLRAIVDYSSIQFRDDATSGQRRVDASISCGFLEKS
jgi:hypothetical protein